MCGGTRGVSLPELGPVFQAKQTPVHRKVHVSAPWGAKGRTTTVTAQAVITKWRKDDFILPLGGFWLSCGQKGVLASWGHSGHHCSLSASVVKSRKEIVSRTQPPRRWESPAEVL